MTTAWSGDPAAHRGAPPDGPPRLDDYRRPAVDAARLWSGGLATAVVAALVGLVGVLIARTVLRIAVYAPPDAGVFGDTATVVLCTAAAAAALAATGLVHLLLLSTPRPLAYLGWIVGLLTAAAAVVPFMNGGPTVVALAVALIHLVIGLAIGSLVSGSAVSALRSAAARTPHTRSPGRFSD